LIASGLLLAHGHPATQANPIRLRNEAISTEPSTPNAAQAKSTLPQPPVSGLVLLQLGGALTPGWQA
jgi:hypothetical protein